MFGVGVLTYRQGLLTSMPDELRRTCRAVTVAAAVGFMALAVLAALGDSVDELAGGWNLLAAALALVESVLAVFGPLWALDVARRRLDRPLWRGAELSRAAYAAFMVQAPVLIGLAAALRPVPVVAEVKTVVVAAVGVVVSFWLGVLLVRVPGLRRVL